MNYNKHWPSSLNCFLILSLFTLSIFSGCQTDLPTVPDQSVFTKPKLEKLGDMLRQELITQHEVLPNQPPYDTSVYWYLNTLYAQVTSTMHLDKKSPSINRWDQARPWAVYVIKDDSSKIAFSLPGGEFFVSTGILRSYERDYEVYALMSFEAALMNDGHLLTKWVQEYNSLTINNLIEGVEQPGGFSAAVLAEEMQQFVFDPEIVKELDKAAIDNTCNTSILSPLGLAPSLDNPDFIASKWLQTRPSYSGRTTKLPEFAADNCEGRQKGDNYQRFVLNQLN